MTRVGEIGYGDLLIGQQRGAYNLQSLVFRTLDFNRSLEPVASFDNKTTHIGLSAFLTFLSLMCGHLNLLEFMQEISFRVKIDLASGI